MRAIKNLIYFLTLLLFYACSDNPCEDVVCGLGSCVDGECVSDKMKLQYIQIDSLTTTEYRYDESDRLETVINFGPTSAINTTYNFVYDGDTVISTILDRTSNVLEVWKYFSPESGQVIGQDLSNEVFYYFDQFCGLTKVDYTSNDILLSSVSYLYFDDNCSYEYTSVLNNFGVNDRYESIRDDKIYPIPSVLDYFGVVNPGNEVQLISKYYPTTSENIENSKETVIVYDGEGFPLSSVTTNGDGSLETRNYLYY